MKQTKLWIIAAILLLGCTGRQNKPPAGDIFDETNLPAGEKMILEAQDNYDTKRWMALADSLGKAGAISSVTANYYHAGAAIHKGMLKEAEKYLKDATADSLPDPADMRLYLRSRALLSRVLTTEGDFEGALKEAIPTLAMMDSLGCKNYGDMSQVHIVIGECQQNLHMPAEAAAAFDKAYTLLQQWMSADTTGTYMPRIIIRLDNISSGYINTSEYAKAKIWLEREDSALAIYNTKPNVIEKQADLLKGSIQLDLAETCQRLGLSEEAARHYDEHRQTHYSTHHIALITACDYLLAVLTHATQGMMPAEICTSMNNALAGEDNVNAMFVTMFIGLLDLQTGHLDFCNAGHNAPVLGGGELGGEFLDMLPNAPIGLWPGLEYEGEEIENIKGRQLFIYTDGLNEAENRHQEQFGDDRLLEILRAIHHENARQVIEAIEAEVEKHRDGAEPNDDLTMMCIKL